MNLFSKIRMRLSLFVDRVSSGKGAPNKNNVFKNMLVLASGTGTAKAIGFLSIPMVTRLFSPEQFGLFTVFLSLTALATPLTSLRYSAALPLPRRDEVARSLMFASLSILVVTCGIISLILALCGASIFNWLAAPALESVWPLLILSLASAGGYEILSSWSVRCMHFKTLARAEISVSLLAGLLKICLALVGQLRVGLMMGHVLAQAGGCVILAAGEIRRLTRIRWGSQRRLMMASLRRYADFPRYRLPSQILLTISVQTPIFLVSATHGPAVAGQLGLAFTTLAVPITLIVQTTAQAYYAEIAKIGAGDPARIYQISREVTIKLLMLGLLPTLVLMLGGPKLFSVFFGERWHQAGIFSSLLAIYLLAQFVSNPLANALNVFNRQKLYLRFDAIRAAITLAVFGSSVMLKLSATVTVAAYAIGLAFYYVLNSIAVFRVISFEMQKRANLHPRLPAVE